MIINSYKINDVDIRVMVAVHCAVQCCTEYSIMDVALLVCRWLYVGSSMWVAICEWLYVGDSM